MKTAAMIVCLPLAAAALPATADVTPIGEFVGDAIETFENIGPPQSYDGGMGIFGGTALLNDELTNSPWITTSLNGPEGTVFPYDGFFMGLAPTGWVRLQFDTPASRFGGFLAAAFTAPAGDVSFFDEGGQLIDTQSIALPTTNWSWYGWESDTPISSIVIHAGANPGVTLVMDNLQISYVPAPAAAALLAFGAILPRRRRR